MDNKSFTLNRRLSRLYKTHSDIFINYVNVTEASLYVIVRNCRQ